MNKLDLYHRLPYPVKTLAASAWGYYLKWWRYDAQTEQRVGEILDRDSWSLEKWKNWQEEWLAFILNRAAKQVPYYRASWNERRRKGDRSSWEVLANWPVLTKQVLRTHSPKEFLVEGENPKKLYAEHTSGTTGTPLTIYNSRETLQNWYAIYEARIRRWNDVSIQDRWGILGGQLVIPQPQTKPPYWIWNQGLKQLYLSSYHIKQATTPHYLNTIKKHKLVYLLGYPSAIYSLAGYGLKQKITPPELKVIIANAEPLSDWQKETIEEFFQCPIKNTYGMSENVCAAGECPAGNLHTFPEVGITEVLEYQQDTPVAAGETGRLICTGLLNAEFPLIRYEVGDSGALQPGSGSCSCGKKMPILSNLEGRMDDLILTPDGRRLGRLDPVFKAGFNILEAQIIQQEIDHLLVKVIPGPDFDEAEQKKIADSVLKYVGDCMQIEILSVSEIPRTKAGKFKAVVSNLASID